MMVQNDCGEIPIIDTSNRPVGVVTDRDIVCRAVAEGKNPAGYPAENVMTNSVVTVTTSATVEEVVERMRDHQLRRMPVVDDDGCLVGIIAQPTSPRKGRRGKQPNSSATCHAIPVSPRAEVVRAC